MKLCNCCCQFKLKLEGEFLEFGLAKEILQLLQEEINDNTKNLIVSMNESNVNNCLESDSRIQIHSKSCKRSRQSDTKSLANTNNCYVLCPII
jgi:hypothetical protein